MKASVSWRNPFARRPDVRRKDPAQRSAQVGASAAITAPPEVLATKAEFDALARTGAQPGASGLPEVKFLIDRGTHRLYFLPQDVKFHAHFARQYLGYRGSDAEFTREAYGRPDRRFIPGSIIAYDSYQAAPGAPQGAYALSFWSTDRVRSPLLLEAYASVRAALPFASAQLFYRPGGDSQEALLDADNGADRKAIERAGLKILTNAEISESLTYSALNPGTSYGVLRVFTAGGAGQQEPTRRDIAFYDGEVPSELPPVAGIGTTVPQASLSHVALKAAQDKSPYAYSKTLLTPEVRALEGKLVRYVVTAHGYQLTEVVTPEEKAKAAAYFESLRPPRRQVFRDDLTATTPLPLRDLGFANARAYGSKVSNVAELSKLSNAGALNRGRRPNEPEVIAPDGFGIPKSWFRTYLTQGRYDATRTFEQRLKELMAEPRFQTDTVYRREQLADLRERMREGTLPVGLQRQLDAFGAAFKTKFPNRNMRLRSSSSSEDIEGFSGAGLFDSATFDYDRANDPGRSLADRLKRVWSSVYNDRAWDELDFYRIAPESVNMGVLVTPNERNEIANGVVRWGGGVPGFKTMVVNAQVRDVLVTESATGGPDVYDVGDYGLSRETEISHVSKTREPLVPGRTAVLNQGEILALYRAMEKIQNHFAALYGRQNDPTFFIESEFKIDSAGRLIIKQARPLVR